MSCFALGRATSKTSAKKKTFIKTFRLPSELVEILATSAKQNGTTISELLVSILTKYATIDRFAQDFGLVTISKGVIKAFADALPDEKLREIAISQSVNIEETTEFLFKKKNLDGVLALIDLSSRHLMLFEYTTSRSDQELTITMRSDLGRKAMLFAAAYWEDGIAKTLGVTPKVVLGQNQFTLTLPV